MSRFLPSAISPRSVEGPSAITSPASMLDEEGIIRIGAEVDSTDILVGKVTPKGENYRLH